MQEKLGRRLERTPLFLLAPAVLAFGLLLVLPFGKLIIQSFREFKSGYIGSASDAPFTLENYAELLDPAYALYLLDTFSLSLIATLLALVIGYLIAFIIARNPSRMARRGWLAFLVCVLFLSVLVRVYAIGLAFGPGGLQRAITTVTGLRPNSLRFIQGLVILGMLNYLVPIAALTLIGTIQNVNPRLAEAAQSLGAARWYAHLTTTVPLSARGLLAAFLILYTLSISAFVVPMILGRGQILFVSNLIYARFSEVSNYSSGAAISVVMLVVSLMTVLIAMMVAEHRWRSRSA